MTKPILRPNFGDLEVGNAAACELVCRHSDNDNWEDALLTLNGDANSGLEYQDQKGRYEHAKAYFLAKAARALVNLAPLFEEYEKPA